MNKFSEFFQKIARCTPCYFDYHDLISKDSKSFFYVLKKEGILIPAGYMRQIEDKFGNIEPITFLSSEEKQKDKVAYYQSSHYGSGRMWLNDHEVRRWSVDMEKLLSFFAKKWDLSGNFEVIENDNFWLLGRANGINIIYICNPEAAQGKNLKKFREKLVFVPTSKQLEQGYLCLENFVTFDIDKKKINVESIKDEIQKIQGLHEIDDDEFIVLQEECECRFYRNAKLITYIKPGENNPIKIKLEARVSDLLYFFYFQEKRNTQQKYFDDESIMKKLPRFNTAKDLKNAKGELSNLHNKEEYAVLPKLLEEDELGRLRISQNLSCVKNMRKKRSQKSSQN